jgi:hypothetical protein
MAEYKLYRAAGESITDAPVIFEAPSDAAAIRVAEELVVKGDLQLWQQDRFVTTVKRLPGKEAANRDG